MSLKTKIALLIKDRGLRSQVFRNGVTKDNVEDVCKSVPSHYVDLVKKLAGPVVESPVVESPVVESPVVESPVVEETKKATKKKVTKKTEEVEVEVASKEE
jgi:hypothetical protein